MQKFSIPAEDFDLEQTMTCGQTFCWHRVNGKLYEEASEDQESSESEKNSRFYTFRNKKPIIVEEKDNEIIVETELPREEVEEALGIHHDLEDIFQTFPENQKLSEAKEYLWGLRIVQDEFFPCLISYLLSPQMRIPRIKKMHNEIARKYGETREINGKELLRFPTREELSQASEEELRELGTGYRAKYIVETLKILEEESFEAEEVGEMEYVEAREEMKKLYGVGDKVADCVLLFSLGFYEAYPIDTWADKALKSHFEDLYADKYDQLSENMREHFGEYSGYAQEYIFHAARKGHIEVE
ncbi:DNA-3-methyladenine glycosylase family protein [Candidatus Nanohalovita haloferacivicina]|uniref:DNA-3-methyladenine glycosylase family protein n=1 Tax=Candidatus Nanohalovita haloferacivicina TaxID=2978046 RepID=UPI00325FD53B|nr:3-methyladenine DNA glycosylase/8-oxoguanine DNAglycosylase [Candidatus Nanohalobia archaeon BNXNv]